MIKKLLPIILLLFGTGAGVGAGVYLRPAAEQVEPAEDAKADKPHSEKDAAAHGKEGDHGDESGSSTRDYVKMNNQFVVPVVEKGAVSALVLLALSIETEPGYRETIFQLEPKLRDSFLQVLFDHANVGGFRGSFTDNNNLDVLRAALREVARRDAGDFVTDVLIYDIARQDY